MRDVSVLVLDGHSDFALSTVRCLGAAGVSVHVLSRRRQVPAVVSRYVTSAHYADNCDDDHYVRQMLATAGRVGATVCLAVDEPAIRLVAQHAGCFSGRVRAVAVPRPDRFDTAGDKWTLATFLEAHGLPHPRTMLGSRLAEHPEQARGPLLLKPRRGGNGVGIRRFEDAGDAVAYVSAHARSCDDYIVQDYVVGSDIDCSVLCDRGRILACTMQQSFTAPSAAFRPAGGIDFVADPRVLAVVRRLMAALDWHGVAHIDLRYDARRQALYVIEMNPRFWGSLLGSLHAGVNFPYLACLHALDVPIDEPVARACRFVAGSTALRAWRAGKCGRRAGFRFADTVFADVCRDVTPSLVEIGDAAVRRVSSLWRDVVNTAQPNRLAPDSKGDARNAGSLHRLGAYLSHTDGRSGDRRGAVVDPGA